MQSLRFLRRLPLSLLIISSVANAKPTVDLSGQVRTREELRGELFTPAEPTGEKTRDETHLRTRLRLDTEVNTQLAITIEFQDVRLLGEEQSTTGTIDGVDLKRGFIEVTPNASDTTIRVGRWVMAYGDQRLVGSLEWVDQGRSYDGVHVSYKPSKTYVDVFAVRVRETLDAMDDQHFAGIYSGIAIRESAVVELYALGLRDALDSGLTFATLGVRGAINHGALDGSAEAAVQIGEVGDQEIVAVAAAVSAGVVIETSRRIRVGGELAYASGDSDPNDSADNTFRTLFPTNHIYYGHADLVAWQNVLALRASLSSRPTKSITASLDVHHLRLAESAGGWLNAAGVSIRPGDSSASAELGNEIDAVVGWKPIEGLALQTGVAVFLGGDFVADTGGGGNAVFAYLQAQATF